MRDFCALSCQFQENPKGYQNGWFSKWQVFFTLELGILVPVHLGTRLDVSLFRSTQRGIKTDGYNDKFFEFWKIGILVPICFGARLGASRNYQSRFWGRGGDEALLNKKSFSVKRGEAIQWTRGLARISTGKAIQWRGQGHSVNSRTLKTEKLLSSSPSQKSALILWNQRKTKGQQLKGKIVSALFHTFPHFSHFSPMTFSKNQAFS